MAFGLTRRRERAPAPARRPGRLATTALAAAITLALAAVVALVLTVGSQVTLTSDATALARLSLPPFAGSLEHATAYGPAGKSIPLALEGDRLTPLAALTPGERVTIDVVVRRPGWLSWALGATHREQLTLTAPQAVIASRWLTLAPGQPLRIHFATPVSAVAYGPPGRLTSHALPAGATALTIPHTAASGSVELALAPRSWESLAAPVTISWFARGGAPQLIASPAAGTPLSALAPIQLTFSQPVTTLFGTALPKLAPSAPGRWTQSDSHTLTFTPTGAGLPLGAALTVTLPHAVELDGAATSTPPTTSVDFTVEPGSLLRLQQVLAQLDYLPVRWSEAPATAAQLPAGTPTTYAGAVAAAVNPPAGSFSWRFRGTPRSLTALWKAGAANVITRGAVMTFEQTHGLAIDGVAGPMVWRALIADELAGRRRTEPYDYVYVRRQLPQLLTLWSDGHVVLTSPGNTGIPQSPTQLGTFPVFEHVTSGTMSGTNPDGSHYDDPGVRYISYFNGGDALHAFPRASYGTPQSLGCVELPLAAAAQLWPYTPIGTLVTIEQQ
jgi:peptidoglycan hydrolase-like protein with peptidoglycan-binding domain